MQTARGRLRLSPAANWGTTTKIYDEDEDDDEE